MATSPSGLGKTSSPSRTKSPIWATHPTPSWKATMVRRAGMLRGAERERGEVDGEQAGAVRDLGEAVGEARDRDRRHRVDAVGRQLHPVQRGDRDRGRSARPIADAERQFEHEQAGHVGERRSRASGSSR